MSYPEGMQNTPDRFPQTEASTMENERLRKKTELVAIHLQNAQRLINGEITPDQFAAIQAERELQAEEMAFIEPMTGLLTRQGLSYEFDKKLQAYSRELTGGGKRNILKGCYVMLDLDNLKPTNDTFGHGVGDLVISYTGQMIRASLRPGDLAARVGGDEFVIILDGDSSEEAVKAMARLKESFTDNEGEFLPAGVHVAASVGITALPKRVNLEQLSQPNFSDLLLNQSYKLADQALYQAKRKGKNQIIVIPPQ